MKYTKEYIESVDFFDLMQAYRMAEPTNQDKVIQKFEDVKDVLRKIIGQNDEIHEALKEIVDTHLNPEKSLANLACTIANAKILLKEIAEL